MRILHLSTWDIRGGAARGAYWLHRALVENGVDSTMLVSEKTSKDVTVIGPETIRQKTTYLLQRKLDNILLRKFRRREPTVFSPAWAPSSVHHWVNALKPDIVHLHWVCSGFVNPGNLARFKAPIVWTFRDMWPFTGGCHYSGACERYTLSCGACPQLNSARELDITHRTWSRKEQSWRALDFKIITISHWLAECAGKSSLLKGRRIDVVHNGLDESSFYPLDRASARESLGLPKDKKVILFGAPDAAMDKRKGFSHVLETAKKLCQNGWAERAVLVVFGSSEPDSMAGTTMDTFYLGHLSEDTDLSRAYSAGDVMLVPSTQEAFGKTAIEAMACGTPVVSFDTGGLKDIVDHQVNGYRARCFSSEDLARGVAWTLEEDERRELLSAKARSTVLEKFTVKRCARSYMEIYEGLLK